MKKILILLFSLFLLIGCNKNSEEYSQEKLAMYGSYYKAVLENTKFEQVPVNFNLTYEVTQKNDGSYLYYLFVDMPKIAMYDVEMIVLEGLNDYSGSDMQPTFGVFDETEFNMIPYQVNTEKGFVKGFVVSGDVQDLKGKLYAMVTWKDLTRLNQMREFVEVTLSLEGQRPQPTPEPTVEPTVEPSATPKE